MIEAILSRVWRQFSSENIWTYYPVVAALLGLAFAYSIALQLRANRSPILRIVFCLLATLSMALFCGLRHKSVGTDTERYYEMVGREFNVTFNQVIENFMPNRLENRDVEELPHDVVFHIVSDQLRMAGLSEYGVFTAYALFYVGVAGWLIYRYSVNPIIGFFGFLALSVYVFDFTGLRQAIAMGWTMLAFPYIQKRQFLFFIFFVLVGMLFHKSAVIFFPAYFLNRFPVRWWSILLICLAVFFVYRKGSVVVELIVKSFGSLDERVEHYFGRENEELRRSVATCAIRFAIFFLYIVVHGRRRFDSEESLLLKMLFIGAVCEMFSLRGWDAMPRLGLYYSAYTMLLLPKLVEEGKHRVPLPYSFTVAAIAITLSLYFMKVVSVYGPYHFNWWGWVNVGIG